MMKTFDERAEHMEKEAKNNIIKNILPQVERKRKLTPYLREGLRAQYIFPELFKDGGSVRYGWSNDVSIWVYYVNSPRDVVPLLRYFRSLGYKMHSAAVEGTDFKWQFDNQKLTIYAVPNTTESSCRMEVIGEEEVTITKKKYKLVCGDKPEEENESD